MFSTAEAILCGNYTPLGQVQIGPIDSLGGQLKEYQIPAGIISTIKLADLAVTVDKLAASSVINSKVAGDAGIIESKLSLDFGTDALNDLISANDIDIASNLALILLREESANKDVANGYLGLDASAKVPLAKLNPLTNSEIDASAEIVESKLNLAFGTSALNTDIQTREESSNKGVASGYCDLDAGVHIPLTRLANLANAQIAAAAAIAESKLNLAYGTSALNTDIQTREESSNKGAVSGYCGLDASQLVPLTNLSNLSNTQIAVAAAIIESKLNLDHSTQSLFDDIATNVTDIGTNVTDIASNLTAILLREESTNKGVASGYCDLDAGVHIPLTRLADLTNSQLAAAAAIIESKLNLDHSTQSLFDKVGTDIGTHAGNANAHHAQSHTLASHSTKAHSELTGIGSSDHHARYADSEAKAACISDAVYGSGWNAVTDVAPSKNAVYDEIDAVNNPPSHATQMQIYNGGVFYNGNNFCCIYLPLNDNNAAFSCRIITPPKWTGTTFTLKLMVALEHASNTFSWIINVKAIDKDGEAWPGTAIWTNDVGHDVTGTGTSLEIQIISISITTTPNIEAGDVLMVSARSDALNADNLYVMDVWIE